MPERVDDYRFGWRWLLPIRDCRTMCLHGFDSGEIEFWVSAFPFCEFLAGNDCAADMHLIDADNCNANEYANILLVINSHEAKVISVIGCRASVAQLVRAIETSFPRVRTYGLLPPGNPRVVIPLASRLKALAGLGLHRPGRRIARLGLAAARVLAFLGSNRALDGRQLVIGSRSENAEPIGAHMSRVAEHLPASQTLDYALYLGTTDDNRKTVVLPIGEANVGAIMKVAATPKAKDSIQNEADALAGFSGSIISNEVPRLFALVESDGSTTLFQEFRNRVRASEHRIRSAVVDFLARLSHISRCQVDVCEILGDKPLMDRQAGIDSVADKPGFVYARIRKAIESGEKIWCHRSHGDFAPWNCAWTRRGLFVYDWEESRHCALAFGDAFYFIVAQAIYVKNRPRAEKIASEALGFAREVADKAGLGDADLPFYFACWLSQRCEPGNYYHEMLVALDAAQGA